MTSSKLSLLALAIAASAFAGACNRSDKNADTAYQNEPAQTAPADTTAPATTPSDTGGASTASTDTTGTATGDMTGTQPSPTAPASTTATPTTTADAATPFDDMDTNNDGALSRDELPQTSPLMQNFSTADKDGNGTLSRAEVDAQRGNMPPPGG